MKFPIDQRESELKIEKQVHSVILRMLRIIDKICKKYQIDYWLDYGSLLGAVRHNGFIPWDHEADIGMLRADYEEFKQIIEKVLPPDLFFQTAETDPLYLSGEIIEGKIRDRYSSYPDHDHFGWQNGIQVDIFVYDLHYCLDQCIVNGFERHYSNGKIYLRFEEIEYLTDREFEGEKFPIPLGFHTYLSRAYGDYMTLPKIEEQKFPNVDPFTPSKHIQSRSWIEKNSNL